MLIKKTLEAGSILRDYTNPEIAPDEDLNSFENQFIVLTITADELLRLALKWNWPKNDKNPELLSAPAWEAERRALLAYGENLKINTKAALCSTFHKWGTSYLIWLEFTGPDNIKHKIDIYLKQKANNGKVYAKKVIDGVPCQVVYDSIITGKPIAPRVAKKLHSIGSITWEGSAETKTQYKLNSSIQQTLFEKVAAECPFVELTQLDPFDDYLYRGDPGQLADYDLTITRKDGTRLTARIDLKVLYQPDHNILVEQNYHDAEILIATGLLDKNHIIGSRVARHDVIDKVENTEEFKEFMRLFKNALTTTPPKYVKLHHIDADTGAAAYSFYN